MTVSLQELKDFLKIRTSDDDSLLHEVLNATLEIVADKVDANVLESGERVFKVRPNGRNLVLPMTHLNELADVTVTDPHGREVPAAELDVNHLSGIVTVRGAIPGAWTVQATPREGNSSIKLAIKIIAKHLYGVQRGTAGARANAYASEGEAMTPGMGYAIPRRAAELLSPYMHL